MQSKIIIRNRARKIPEKFENVSTTRIKITTVINGKIEWRHLVAKIC